LPAGLEREPTPDVATRNDDRERAPAGLRGRWILATLILLFAAYVLGRAVGILLDVDPWVMEAVALVAALAAVIWTARRRER
jgi:hypothetical protein